MFFVRQNATHKLVIGPVVDATDGFTPETTLALATADEACVILHDNATVVSISGYTLAAIASADGYYHLTLQGAVTGTVGHCTVAINDDSLCRPVRTDYTVVEEAVYDAMYKSAALGPVLLGANATAVSFTAGVTISNASGNALTLQSSGGNGYGMSSSGNGTASGIFAIGGDTAGAGIMGAGGSAGGAGIYAVASSGGAPGFHAIGQGAGSGIKGQAGTTGAGMLLTGGTTSGAGMSITTTSGSGMSITPTNGSGILAVGQGTGRHGMQLIGASVGTSDGLSTATGSGSGVPIRGSITGNLSGSVGSVAGNVDGNVTGTVRLADASSDSVIADAVWNAATVTYGTAGTYGSRIETLIAGGDATQAKQDQIIAAVITNAAGADISADIIAVKADTAKLEASHAEPTGAPAANASPLDKLGYVYAALRNKVTVGSAAISYFDDGGATLWTKAIADDGTTFTEDEGA